MIVPKSWCREVNKKVENERNYARRVIEAEALQNLDSRLSLIQPIRSDVFLTSLELL